MWKTKIKEENFSLSYSMRQKYRHEFPIPQYSKVNPTRCFLLSFRTTLKWTIVLVYYKKFYTR